MRRTVFVICAVLFSAAVATSGAWVERFLSRNDAAAAPSPTASAPARWLTLADNDAGSLAGRVTYSGLGWRHVTGFHDGRLNGTSTRSDRAGDIATILFTGRRIALYGVDGRSGGFGIVSIDGGSALRADFFSPVVSPKLVYMSPLLTPGAHSLAVVVTGEREKRSNGEFVNINYAKIQQ